MYTGQFVYAGKKAKLVVGNILPLAEMPEGTLICNLEETAGDRGKVSRCSGDYCTIVTHDYEKVTASRKHTHPNHTITTKFSFFRGPLECACLLEQRNRSQTFAVLWLASLLAVAVRTSLSSRLAGLSTSTR
jgi:hypothetical protein